MSSHKDVESETCRHHNIPDQAVALYRRTVFKPAEHRTTAGRGEVDSVFVSLMLAAQREGAHELTLSLCNPVLYNDEYMTLYLESC